MDVATACLIPSSREEEHHDDINPESAMAESAGSPPVPEENLKSDGEKKARRK
jgi:hypothetical protein